MSEQQSRFLVGEGVAFDELIARLDDGLSIGERETFAHERDCLDSFDWRLWSAGVELSAERLAKGWCLEWRDRAHDEVVERLRVRQPPRLSRELPEGSLRERLAPILDPRALMPLIRVETRGVRLPVLDDERKTVVRVAFEEHRYRTPDGLHEGLLDRRLRVIPVKGYAKPFHQLVHRIAAEPGLEACEVGLYEAAFAAIGRWPGDYSPKLSIVLDPEMRADEAAKQIHRVLLRTIELNVDGARSGIDPEFLHDLRVATRRTRSALAQIKGVFPVKPLEHFKKGFGWLGQVTGPTRDLDVYLLKFDGYRASLPEPVRADLDPFRAFLEAHRREEQARLAKRLGSPHFRRLIKEWRAFLDAPPPHKGGAPKAALPVHRVADRRIHRLYKRVLTEGLAITDASPESELHELRKSCKKLRYLMEYFQSLYPKPLLQPLIKEIKILLDNLGDFQDLAVQAHGLQRFAEQMVAEGKAGVRNLMAMGILVGDLYQRQRQERERFQALFREFSSAANRKVVKELFRSPADTEAGAE